MSRPADTSNLVDLDTGMDAMDAIASLSDFGKAKLVTIADFLADDLHVINRFNGDTRGDNSAVRSLIRKGLLAEAEIGADVTLTDLGRIVAKAVHAQGTAYADELATYAYEVKAERACGIR